MSNNTPQEVEAITQEVAETKPTETDDQSITAKAETMENVDVNPRLLAESKTYKAKMKEYSDENSELKTRLANIEKERLEKNGNAEEKAEYYKNKAAELATENENLKYNTVENKLFSVVGEIAGDCHNINLLLNNPDYESDIKAAVDVKTGEVDAEIIKTIYERDKDKHPYLYSKTSIPKEVDDAPKSNTKPKMKSYTSMTVDERTELKAKLIAEKYGK